MAFFRLLRSLWGLRRGMAFGCKRCGQCCSWPGMVFFTREERSAAAQHLGMSERAFSSAYHLGQTGENEWVVHAPRGCPLLGQNKECAIYPVRPLQCASYPFWRSKLGTPAARRAYLRECPGAGRGRWLKWDTVDARIRTDSRNEFF
ncbi:MAG TPA: YkgJ family cysteine cluster protein [Spirochaetota bacterium]|nr:YkgJ family cysteine cluster protein [Spirochaetota bacterium]